MKTIIVGFSRPIKPTLFAKAIMWADKTDYDHAYIRWTWASIQRDVFYQASKFAVNYESNVTFNGHAVVVEEYQLDISDEAYKTIMQFCMDNSDKPYGMLQIVGFAYVKLVKMLLGKKVHNPFPSHESTFVCSKLAAEVLAKTGLALPESSDDIDPLDLNNIIKAAGLKLLVPISN